MEPLEFDSLPGLSLDDLEESLRVFRRSAALFCGNAAQLRPACPPSHALIAAGRAALAHDGDAAGFFRRRFEPVRLAGRGFLTGYYEPEVEARLTPDAEFPTPVLGRPDDLVTLNEAPIRGAGGEALTSARCGVGGGLAPYPERRIIEEHAYDGKPAAIAYLRDRVELFLIQVQGSARLRLADGRSATLTYDGRNGHPYTSIGRLLIARGAVPEHEMSLARLKATLRDMGLGPDEPGRRLMQENKSYVFFRLDDDPERGKGPIGGQGCALTPLRSIAVDRTRWSYGLPFFISGRIPWEGAAPTPFARLMIAQDTGSAILGEARVDVYFGSGDCAGNLAGGLRHEADFFVLLPRSELTRR
ncbi:MAG TPA: MltA domain-containing protein [Methylocystis sp.]|nr:MltA domain-containing protein [Methylocystis sp.]